MYWQHRTGLCLLVNTCGQLAAFQIRSNQIYNLVNENKYKQWTFYQMIHLYKGGFQKKKIRYLLSLAKKGGRVKAHDQNTKKDKNVVNGGRWKSLHYYENLTIFIENSEFFQKCKHFHPIFSGNPSKLHNLRTISQHKSPKFGPNI